MITYGIPGAFAALAIIGLAVTWCIMRDGEAPRSRARQRAGSARRRVRAITAASTSRGRAAIARRIQGLKNLVPGAGFSPAVTDAAGLLPVTTVHLPTRSNEPPKVDSPAPEQWWLTPEEQAAPLDYAPAPDMWSLLSEDTITRGMTAVTP